MGAWIWNFVTRFALFLASALGLGYGVAWVFGMEGEISQWGAQNRPIVGVLLALSAIIFGIAISLENNPK
jgi:hypothetical protein